jgi:hypothetical protein
MGALVQGQFLSQTDDELSVHHCPSPFLNVAIL